MRILRVFGAIVCATTTAVLPIGTAVAGAAPSAGPSRSPSGLDAFYTPPSPLPAGPPGDLIRTEPLPTAITVPSAYGTIPASATRLLYRSTDATGAPVAVSGYYLEPTRPWTGPGPRPLVVYAGGLHGQGDQCTGSKMLQSGATLAFPGGPMAEIEQIVTYNLVAKGFAVVASDYIGMGTPGVHTFGVRVDQANAVLDAGRAARHLPEVSPESKVAIAGYSQGGAAAAAAAELAASYAPDLPLVGIYAGGTPIDLEKELAYLDGNRLGGVIGYTLNGAMARFPEVARRVTPLLNDYGRETLRQISNECIVLTSARGRPSTRDWTVSHKSFTQLIAEDPILGRYVEDQDVGNRRPTVPVLLTANPDDPTVPVVQGRELYAKWCATKPDSLQYQEVPFPIRLIGASTFGHVAGGISGFDRAIGWLQDRFAAKPPVVGCVRS